MAAQCCIGDVMDKKTTVGELKEKVRGFCSVRDWDQFHNPKDLSIGISTEANELLDIFRFKSIDEMKSMMADEKILSDIRDEISDVLFFILRFSDMYSIDLSDSLDAKIEKNSKKYPIEKSKGSSCKFRLEKE